VFVGMRNYRNFRDKAAIAAIVSRIETYSQYDFASQMFSSGCYAFAEECVSG
jgi:hypothetical protein